MVLKGEVVCHLVYVVACIGVRVVVVVHDNATSIALIFLVIMCGGVGSWCKSGGRCMCF